MTDFVSGLTLYKILVPRVASKGAIVCPTFIANDILLLNPVGAAGKSTVAGTGGIRTLSDQRLAGPSIAVPAGISSLITPEDNMVSKWMAQLIFAINKSPAVVTTGVKSRAGSGTLFAGTMT